MWRKRGSPQCNRKGGEKVGEGTIRAHRKEAVKGGGNSSDGKPKKRFAVRGGFRGCFFKNGSIGRTDAGAVKKTGSGMKGVCFVGHEWTRKMKGKYHPELK